MNFFVHMQHDLILFKQKMILIYMIIAAPAMTAAAQGTLQLLNII